MSRQISGRNRSPQAAAGVAALTMGALGVVFGDIGTSPLYSLQTLFSADHFAVEPNRTDVFGVISLVFWSITMIVSIKFVTFIMRADNDGEGGIMALIALVQRANLRDTRMKTALIMAGLFGVALFYGDGMITPAISVLSAVEGIEVAAPGLSSWVLPITITVLVLLFASQKFGTHVIGRIFGPVMLVWFLVIAAGGISQIVTDPGMLKALSPAYAFDFFTRHPGIAFISLGAITLTLTGAEALYADMGHFGRPPIRRAWFLFVFPALTLNYLGQGSLILESPSNISNPFFLLFPDWSHIPLVLLATMATVIASQAVISGAFSVTRQAIQLGFMPQLSIRHTSKEEIGQVYVPAVNWTLMVAVIVLVVVFGSSTKLASAYGIAVMGTLAIDTLLFLVVVRSLWHKPMWLTLAGAAVFLTIDLTFFSANLTKIGHGGWFPLTIGAVIFIALSTWARGHAAMMKTRIAREGPLVDFVDGLLSKQPPVPRVEGTAVYLNSRSHTAPLALRDGLRRDHVIHQQVVVLSIVTARTPFVDPLVMMTLDDLGECGPGFIHLTAKLGYMDVPDVPALLKLANDTIDGVSIRIDEAFYYLSKVNVNSDGDSGMMRWRKRLYILMAGANTSQVQHFHLPAERSVLEITEIPV